MNLAQLRDKVIDICRPYVKEEDLSHSHLENGISVHLYIEMDNDVYTYKCQFFIGRRHYSVLQNARTPRELLKQIKEKLNPKPPVKGTDINITPKKKKNETISS